MQIRIAALGCAGLLAFAGCAQPVSSPTAPSTASPGSGVPSEPTPAPTSAGPSTRTPTPVPAQNSTPPVPGLTLAGDEIGGRPLGTTPLARVQPLIEARLGTATVGRPRLCRLEGERSPLGVVDHGWPGLTVHTGRRGAVTVVIGWRVDLAQVPEGFRLADRLPWQPTFAELAATPGVTVSTTQGVQTARVAETAITYSGPEGGTAPDTVTGGPDFSCS